ncbi:MAG: metal-dependent hydrolase [Candidatus Pristimantibacillus sp.]
MMGRTHLVISTGVTLSILSMVNQTITLPVLAVAAVSSLLPDIDEPNSLLVSKAIPKGLIRMFQILLIGLSLYVLFYGGTFAPWNSVLAFLVGFVSFMPTRTMRNVVMVLIGVALIAFGDTFTPWNYIIGSAVIVCALVPHRGLTHTIYGVIGWTTLLYFTTHSYGNVIWWAGGISYSLHLFADALTNHGIRPLPPCNFRLKLNLMSTGTWKGSIVENVCIGLTCVLIWFTFFQGIDIKNYFS